VAGDNPADGTLVQLYDCNGTNAQKWNPAAIGTITTSGGGSSSGGGSGSSCNPGAWVYMGNDANACNGNLGEPCGWTSTNEGQGYTCQTTSWGTGCEPGGAVCGGSSGGTSSGSSGGPGAGWTLTWSDEFDGPNGSAVDPSKWRYDTGGSGWGNDELEYYTSGTENAVVENGNLVITATQAGAGQYSCWYGPCQYTSARLNTSGLFSQQYGYFEARIQIPHGQGVWPACGDIDDWDNPGRPPDSVYGTTHGPGPGSYPGDGLSGADNAGSPFSDGFHVYATQWSPNEIDFYVDGSLYWKVVPSMLPAGATWVFDQPFFILLNFAVGGSWPGNPDGTSTWPQQMLVDYVRVYSAQ
jgi:beta-glucanase (GH16 family)